MIKTRCLPSLVSPTKLTVRFIRALNLDYSMIIGDVYREITLFLINHYQSLAILRAVEHSALGSIDLRSSSLLGYQVEQRGRSP